MNNIRHLKKVVKIYAIIFIISCIQLNAGDLKTAIERTTTVSFTTSFSIKSLSKYQTIKQSWPFVPVIDYTCVPFSKLNNNIDVLVATTHYLTRISFQNDATHEVKTFDSLKPQLLRAELQTYFTQQQKAALINT